jgi:hypothetical protein
MPITAYLNNGSFDPETTRIMGVAFEMVRVALGLADRVNLANEIAATRIIELAKTGERNPDLLCERALEALRARPFLAPPANGATTITMYWRTAKLSAASSR